MPTTVFARQLHAALRACLLVTATVDPQREMLYQISAEEHGGRLRLAASDGCVLVVVTLAGSEELTPGEIRARLSVDSVAAWVSVARPSRARGRECDMTSVEALNTSARVALGGVPLASPAHDTPCAPIGPYLALAPVEVEKAAAALLGINAAYLALAGEIGKLLAPTGRVDVSPSSGAEQPWRFAYAWPGGLEAVFTVAPLRG